MTNFSTNQVMQFYVADSDTILPYKDEKAFKISFPSLGITSDKIENVEWAKLTKAAKLQPKAKKAAWLDKKADMKPKCEELYLFKCVQNGLRTWDEKVIKERNAWLADKILDAWSK